MKHIIVGLFLLISAVSAFDPRNEIGYHLFTRANSATSQVISHYYPETILSSNYDVLKPTKLIIHGWRDTALGSFGGTVIPALLNAEDVNVIVIDWSPGAQSLYTLAMLNVLGAGTEVANFINHFLNTSQMLAMNLQIIGFGLGGHLAGVIGRQIASSPGIITALDPSFHGWTNNRNKLQSTDAVYVEVLHTNVAQNGYDEPLGHVDFYSSGGEIQPGCGFDNACSHSRAFTLFVESLTSQNFIGSRCEDWTEAITTTCTLTPQLHFGGTSSKQGSNGVYRFNTNANSPFAQG